MCGTPEGSAAHCSTFVSDDYGVGADHVDACSHDHCHDGATCLRDGCGDCCGRVVDNHVHGLRGDRHDDGDHYVRVFACAGAAELRAGFSILTFS
jgi:hypothetical protein